MAEDDKGVQLPHLVDLCGMVTLMAVETGELLHSCAMHFLALMTSQTVPLFQAELVRAVAMTFGAFDPLYKDMLCMVP